MKANYPRSLQSVLFFATFLFAIACSSKDGKNGFERTIEGINKVGKGASRTVKDVDTTLEKVSKTATEASEHLEKYVQDSVK